LPVQAGERVVGEHLRVGYFAQHQLEALDPLASPFAHLQRLSATATEQALRDFLGGYGFQGELAMAPAGQLSGGEQARLALAMIAWLKPNLLLLDEPTNHLDLEMRHALTLALQEYPGAVLLVSHDRHLLKNSVDEFWLVANGRVQVFDGDLEDYRRLSLAAHRADPPSASGTGSEDTTSTDRREGRRAAAAQREQLRPLRQRIARLEGAMEQAQAELGRLETRLADPRLYEGSGGGEVQALLREQGLLRQHLAGLEEQWLQASEELEAAAS